MARKHVEEVRSREGEPELAIRLGREELLIRNRYQVASMLNDFLIGLWFLLGSIAFLWQAWQEAGVWLFILGSAQLLVRPLIRLSHRFHLKSVPPGRWEM
ncbi:MAG: YrhK family protein [Thiohalorhabdus sp.]